MPQLFGCAHHLTLISSCGEILSSGCAFGLNSSSLNSHFLATLELEWATLAQALLLSSKMGLTLTRNTLRSITPQSYLIIIKQLALQIKTFQEESSCAGKHTFNRKIYPKTELNLNNSRYKKTNCISFKQHLCIVFTLLLYKRLYCAKTSLIKFHSPLGLILIIFRTCFVFIEL